MNHIRRFNEDNMAVDETSFRRNVNLIKDIILKFEDSGEIVYTYGDEADVYYDANVDGIRVSIWNYSSMAQSSSFEIYMRLKHELEKHGFIYVNELIVKDTKMVFSLKPKYSLRPSMNSK